MIASDRLPFSWRLAGRRFLHQQRVLQRCRLLSALAALTIATQLLSFPAPDAASADPATAIQETGGGMIQFKAAGETFYFRQAEAKVVFPGQLPFSCTELKRFSFISLSDILGIPNIRKCIAAENFAWDGFFIWPRLEDGFYYPGHVSEDVFPPPGAGRSINFTFNGYKGFCSQSYIGHGGGVADRLGFERFSFRQGPHETNVFVLPASLRLGADASRPLCITCAPLVTTGRDCLISLSTPGDRIVMSINWSTGYFHGPDQSWLIYDQTMRNIAHSILADRPKGYMQ